MTDLSLLWPQSVNEASHMLKANGGEAKVLAGGTAVVLMLTQGLISPRVLVSLDRITDCRGLTHESGVGLRIGALVTHYQVETSPLVRQKCPVMAETFHKVANIRVRHRATVGGVVCEADYASDPPTVLVALRAQARVVGPHGERKVGVADLITGFYETTLAPDEILIEIIVPDLPSDSRATYVKFNSRSSEDRPCVGVAAVACQKAGVCEDLRVVVGAVAGTLQEVPPAEALAIGQTLTVDLAREIGRRYAETINPISDIRGSDWYRRQVIEVLVRRAILTVANQARR